jgi:large-conductance mechanosensitive channel
LKPGQFFSLAIDSICSLIFGLIVNTIVTNIIKATTSVVESDDFSLMTASARNIRAAESHLLREDVPSTRSVESLRFAADET